MKKFLLLLTALFLFPVQTQAAAVTISTLTVGDTVTGQDIVDSTFTGDNVLLGHIDDVEIVSNGVLYSYSIERFTTNDSAPTVSSTFTFTQESDTFLVPLHTIGELYIQNYGDDDYGSLFVVFTEPPPGGTMIISDVADGVKQLAIDHIKEDIERFNTDLLLIQASITEDVAEEAEEDVLQVTWDNGNGVTTNGLTITDNDVN